MRCPKCRFVSSDKKDLCPSCHIDLRPYKHFLGLPISNPKSALSELLRAHQNETAPKPKFPVASIPTPRAPAPEKSQSKPPAPQASHPQAKQTQVGPQVTQKTQVASQRSNASIAPVKAPSQVTPESAPPLAIKSEFFSGDSDAIDIFDEDLEVDAIQLSNDLEVRAQKPAERAAKTMPEVKSTLSTRSPHPSEQVDPLPSLEESALDEAFTKKINSAKPSTLFEELEKPAPAVTPPRAPVVAPQVMEFGDTDELFDQHLDSLIGDTVLDISAVREKREEPATKSGGELSDDDIEISFEFDIEGEEVDVEANEAEPTSNAHSGGDETVTEVGASTTAAVTVEPGAAEEEEEEEEEEETIAEDLAEEELEAFEQEIQDEVDLTEFLDLADDISEETNAEFSDDQENDPSFPVSEETELDRGEISLASDSSNSVNQAAEAPTQSTSALGQDVSIEIPAPVELSATSESPLPGSSSPDSISVIVALDLPEDVETSLQESAPTHDERLTSDTCHFIDDSAGEESLEDLLAAFDSEESEQNTSDDAVNSVGAETTTENEQIVTPEIQGNAEPVSMLGSLTIEEATPTLPDIEENLDTVTQSLKEAESSVLALVDYVENEAIEPSAETFSVAATPELSHDNSVQAQSTSVTPAPFITDDGIILELEETPIPEHDEPRKEVFHDKVLPAASLDEVTLEFEGSAHPGETPQTSPSEPQYSAQVTILNPEEPAPKASEDILKHLARAYGVTTRQISDQLKGFFKPRESSESSDPAEIAHPTDLSEQTPLDSDLSVEPAESTLETASTGAKTEEEVLLEVATPDLAPAASTPLSVEPDPTNSSVISSVSNLEVENTTSQLHTSLTEESATIEEASADYSAEVEIENEVEIQTPDQSEPELARNAELESTARFDELGGMTPAPVETPQLIELQKEAQQDVLAPGIPFSEPEELEMSQATLVEEISELSSVKIELEDSDNSFDPVSGAHEIHSAEISDPLPELILDYNLQITEEPSVEAASPEALISEIAVEQDTADSEISVVSETTDESQTPSLTNVAAFEEPAVQTPGEIIALVSLDDWEPLEVELALSSQSRDKTFREIELAAVEVYDFSPTPTLTLLFDVTAEEILGLRVAANSEMTTASALRTLDNDELNAVVTEVADKIRPDLYEKKRFTSRLGKRGAKGSENIKPEHDLRPTTYLRASAFRRIVATSIDSIATILLSFVMTIFFVMKDADRSALFAGTSPEFTVLLEIGAATIQIAAIVWVLGNWLFVVGRGQTTGQKVVGIYVFAERGEIPGLLQSFNRALLVSFTYLTLGLVALPALGKRGATLHDSLSRTVVGRIG